MDRILGQSSAIRTLASQLATGRVHHAQVFHGPAGVGKFTTALAFARVLLCHDPMTDLHGGVSACGSCKSCKLLRPTIEPGVADGGGGQDPSASFASAHPDLHLITKELALFDDDAQVRGRKLTSIPVGVVREHLIGPAGLAPALGHGKVFIVDEAELLNATGQNALLKTLEEPSPGTVIVLVTSSEDRLLPTIRSRCQRVAFGPLSDDAVDRWLGDQHNTLDDQTRRWIVGFAMGSIGRASLAVRYGLVQWGADVLGPLQRIGKTGRPDPELGGAIAGHVTGFAEAWVSSHKNASKEAANRQAAALMGSMIANFARRRLAEQAQHCDPETPAASEQALSPWLEVIAAVGEFEGQLASNVNLTLCCEGLGMALQAALLGVATR